MHNPFHRFMVTMMFIAICLIILGDFVFAEEKSKSQWLSENPCMIKTETTTVEKCLDSECLIKETIVTKEEVLKCNDGYDGNGYGGGYDGGLSVLQLGADVLGDISMAIQGI